MRCVDPVMLEMDFYTDYFNLLLLMHEDFIDFHRLVRAARGSSKGMSEVKTNNYHNGQESEALMH